MSLKLMELPKLISVKHGPEPTWDSDAGRFSISGVFTGTFVGFVNTLEISIGSTTQAELTQIRSAIEHAVIEDVKFIDTADGTEKMQNFYGTTIYATKDYGDLYKPFTFKLIAIRPRD